MGRLTPLQLDALGESGNISMGAAATALSQLLGHNVEITTPRLSYTTIKEIRENHPVPCVFVRVSFTDGLEGSNVFILSDRDAGVIANMMMGNADQDVPETLDELYLSAVSEAMNQMMGSSATAMSEMFGRTIDITPPELEYVNLQNSEDKSFVFGEEQEVVQIAFDLTVGEYISSTMLQLLPEDFADMLVKEMFGDYQENAESQEQTPSLLTPEQKDALLEVGQITMDPAAGAVAAILGKTVTITPSYVEETTIDGLCESQTGSYLLANIQYQNAISGVSTLALQEPDAAVIAAMMMGDPDSANDTIDEIQLSAVGEAISQMIGASVTALSNTFAKPVEIGTPEVFVSPIEQTVLSAALGSEPLIKLTYDFSLEDTLDGTMLQIMPISYAMELISLLLMPLAMESDEEPKEPALPDFDVSEPLAEETESRSSMQSLPSKKREAAAYVSEETFPEGSVPLDLIRDISVRITGVLGRCRMSLSELMSVTAGTVAELDAAANDSVEILANGKLVARGEIVLYKDQFGVKITEIIQPWQRK